MPDACALIAGAGSFPLHVAREAKAQGFRVIAIGLTGWVDPTLASHVDAYEEVAVGELGRLIARLKSHGVRQAVMAGKVTKEVLFDPRVQFDADAVAILSGTRDYTVPGVLGAIGARLAQDGIQLLDSSTFLRGNVCPAGVLTKRGPTEAEQDDIEVGRAAARRLADLDIGQTVVVKRRVIVAVEALEGTDATIRRARELAGPGGVVVKMAARQQDRRFDLPILGPQTVSTAIEAGVTCLAVEAGSTLLLDKAGLLEQANSAKLCLIGIECPTA